MQIAKPLQGPEGGQKLLTLITTPPTGHSANYLKTVVHAAKICIRPIQRILTWILAMRLLILKVCVSL